MSARRRAAGRTRTAAFLAAALLASGGAALLEGCGSTESQEPPESPRPEELPLAISRGQAVYRAACSSCHGERGDGQGPQARRIKPRPSNLTRAVFKCRSTASGVLPLDKDIFATVSYGMPPGMPGFAALLSPMDRRDVVAYTKSLSPRFKQEVTIDPQDVLTVPTAPEATPESIARGKEVYRKRGCAKCHGIVGRGDGSSAGSLTDDAGRPIAPADLVYGPAKCGSAPEDIYRLLYTGLDGTPMKSYADSVSDADRWPLVHYVGSLRRSPGILRRLLVDDGR